MFLSSFSVCFFNNLFCLFFFLFFSFHSVSFCFIPLSFFFLFQQPTRKEFRIFKFSLKILENNEKKYMLLSTYQGLFYENFMCLRSITSKRACVARMGIKNKKKRESKRGGILSKRSTALPELACFNYPNILRSKRTFFGQALRSYVLQDHELG